MRMLADTGGTGAGDWMLLGWAPFAECRALVRARVASRGLHRAVYGYLANKLATHVCSGLENWSQHARKATSDACCARRAVAIAFTWLSASFAACSVEALVTRAGDASYQIRMTVAVTLGAISTEGHISALRALKHLSCDVIPSVRWAAVVSMGRLVSQGDVDALEIVASRLADSIAVVRKVALEALQQIAERGDVQLVRAIAKHLGSHRRKVRQIAVVALGRLAKAGDADAMSELISHRGDGNQKVRKAAAVALGRIAERANGTPQRARSRVVSEQIVDVSLGWEDGGWEDGAWDDWAWIFQQEEEIGGATLDNTLLIVASELPQMWSSQSEVDAHELAFSCGQWAVFNNTSSGLLPTPTHELITTPIRCTWAVPGLA